MAAASVKGKIYEAMAARCQDMATQLALPISMPNVTFTPPTRDGARKPYLSVRYMPNGSELDGLGFASDETTIGLLQVSVFWPASEGLVKPTDMADRVAGWWPAGTDIWYQGVRVQIDRAPAVATSLQESDLVQVPVTIRWRAGEIKA